jgi:DNA-binding transcriptional LysR family regulator
MEGSCLSDDTKSLAANYATFAAQQCIICIIVSAYPGDLLLHLASFVVLLRHLDAGARGAFEQAAHDLGVDRSVLRRRIQTLGRWMETPLLQGRGTRMSASAAGLRLAERAVSMLDATKHLKADVALARSRLSIACTGTVATELLPRVLVDLENERPPVQLAVRRAGGSACERLVRSRDVDLGVVRSDAPPAAFASRHLADDRLWLVVSGSHPMARSRARPTLDAMARIPLILFGEASRTRARVMDRLGPRGGVIRVEVDGKASALEYVRAGLGASFLSLLPGHRIAVRGVWARDVTRLFGASRFYIIGRRERWGETILSSVVRQLAHHARG